MVFFFGLRGRWFAACGMFLLFLLFFDRAAAVGYSVRLIPLLVISESSQIDNPFSTNPNNFLLENALRARLLEKEMAVQWLRISKEAEDRYKGYLPILWEAGFYDWEMVKSTEMREDIASDVISKAAADLFQWTPLGSTLKRIEQQLRRYFKAEYSRGVNESEGSFYLPGQVTEAVEEKEKLYSLSLSSYIYVDLDRMQPHASLRAHFDYYEAEAGFKYESEEALWELEYIHPAIGSFFGSRPTFSLAYDRNRVWTCMIRMVLRL